MKNTIQYAEKKLGKLPYVEKVPLSGQASEVGPNIKLKSDIRRRT